MIGYTMVGTNDLARSVRFYHPLFSEMGLDQCWQDDQTASWGKTSDENFARFSTGYPFDGKEANVGNGTMTAFLFDNKDMIDRLYQIAMREGAISEGEPGFRPQYGDGFYGAYVRDPDGNKIAFVCYHAEKSS